LSQKKEKKKKERKKKKKRKSFFQFFSIDFACLHTLKPLKRKREKIGSDLGLIIGNLERKKKFE
jgi:hypothetical protein